MASNYIRQEDARTVRARDTSSETAHSNNDPSQGEVEKTLTQKQSLAFKVNERLRKWIFQTNFATRRYGGGKTELYLQLIRRLIDQDGTNQILVMVPEISLTPQMTSVFERRFPGRVAVVHSNQPDQKRWQALESIRTGKNSVLIGPRSSVFAPFKSSVT